MDWTYVILFLAGFAAFVISTIAGGGGALLLLPVVTWRLGAAVTAPVVQLGNFIGRPVRLILFWKYIDWNLVKYYLPSALLGGFLGAWLFANLEWKWLQLILGLFLISTIFQYRFGKKERSFPVRMWYFIPLGFLVSFISSLIGGMGPVLNPFYLNYGLQKEPLIATKTANSFFVAIVQLSTYSFFGALSGDLWLYGLCLGLGAAAGNWFGKNLLQRMTNLLFRRLLIAVMVISGIFMIFQLFQ